MRRAPLPFAAFTAELAPRSALRSAITAAYRRSEPDSVPALIAAARLDPAAATATQSLARRLVGALRGKRSGSGVEALIQEFSLDSQEGVALMCLAEAMLRIPDNATRDALIRDKIGAGDWASHASRAQSLFVNAATWGLMITGKLVATSSHDGLSAALTRLIAKGGEPVIRRGVDLGMRLMGEQFVCGETIAKALAGSRRAESRGYRFSYDMLGEAATTAHDAARYYVAYEEAIHAIGKAAAGRGLHEGPGISIKLSALHPRYSRAQRARVLDELLPRVRALTGLARHYNIGLNIDAEEADRLELSLDLLEALCFDPALAGWDGIGFVVQAYQKRAPLVLDFLIDLAKRSGHRLMLRLVKGAYWDSEIKRAQVDGLADYPVYTRKIYTDTAYIACAKKLLAAPDAIFPQFATHNALTLAAIYQLAGPDYRVGQYEFQCLHGMGEPLYDEVVAPAAHGGLDRPCRIYAPVGTHETLLAYLVRRLLENGANTSFVNRIGDPDVSIDDLVVDPIEAAGRVTPSGAPHPRIPLPHDLFGSARANSTGIDFSNENVLAELSAVLGQSSSHRWLALPMPENRDTNDLPMQSVLNPADHSDIVGQLMEGSAADAVAALERAVTAAPNWRATPVPDRAACLERAATLLQERIAPLLGLLVREAGKSLPNAVAEVREAVDFLRYYAVEVRREFDNATHIPLGPVVCISPWNFPLAIFMGQVSAALAAGNPVIAKPAEQTALVAAEAVRILHAAGVPTDVLQLLPGSGEKVGAALVADWRTKGVVFTGSTEVARSIAQSLANREPQIGCVDTALVAETGGQNAMIVDSSALAEQVVQDVVLSAFDSAGQRCSALRILCLQEDIAERVLHMLKGALAELIVGNPDSLATDIGPVIDAQARDQIEIHVKAMAALGCPVHRLPLREGCAAGTFVAPTIIEIVNIAVLEREVFGPVLHVLRYRRDDLDALLADIRNTGYGLTFGVHSRIDETIERAIGGTRAGNVYVNRNMVGAVVGVQPFGGQGLSGTGPKAGGPHYLRRLLAASPLRNPGSSAAPTPNAVVAAFGNWLLESGETQAACIYAAYLAAVPAMGFFPLPGPTGELNTYSLAPRGNVLCRAQTRLGVLTQLTAVLATGNRACFMDEPVIAQVRGEVPELVRIAITLLPTFPGDASVQCETALFEGEIPVTRLWCRQLANRNGPIVTTQSIEPAALAQGTAHYALDRLIAERSVSVNAAAAGGNASLMTIG